jgi:tripartite-type tricarboxylate transporter receptor subunit TctC
LRALATTGSSRSTLVPQVPTMRESGVDLEVIPWYGVLAPAATPPAIIDRLAAALVKLTRSTEVASRLKDLGAEPVGSSPEEFGKHLRAELPMWEEAVRISGARAD